MWMVIALHNSHDKTIHIYGSRKDAEEAYKEWLEYYEGIEDMVEVEIYLTKIEESKII